MSKKNEFSFCAEDFWKLIKEQKYQCVLTGKELTPHNTEVELREPSKVTGRTALSNLYCIDKSLSQFARFNSEDEIIELAIEIVKHRGKEKGITIRRSNKNE